jgi:hypothetical protein
MSQMGLVRALSISAATVSNLEGYGEKPIRGKPAILNALKRGLEDLGVDIVRDFRTSTPRRLPPGPLAPKNLARKSPSHKVPSYRVPHLTKRMQDRLSAVASAAETAFQLAMRGPK